MWYLPTWWECCCSLEMEGSWGTEILLQSLNPTVEPSNRHGIALSTLLFTMLGWGWKGWWMGNCRVIHESYPFTADRNRCHWFLETDAIGFHLTHGLLFIFSNLHFLFLPTFFLCLLYPFWHSPLSEMWIWEILMKCEKSKVCNLFKMRMSSFFWTWEDLAIYG
jgi:hypothetical protein